MSKDFLESPQGMRLLYRSRERRAIRIHIDDLEPASKTGMSAKDKTKFQRRVAQEMETFRRKAFVGPVALEIWAGTTRRNPSHVQNVAKNLLDLLSKPTHIRHTSNTLLYKDDNQVQGLSVRCDHGCASPFIWITAVPFSSVLYSLDIIGSRRHYLDRREGFDSSVLDQKLDLLRDLELNKAQYEDEMFGRLHQWYRAQVQSSWLNGSCISPGELGLFYHRPRWSKKPWDGQFKPLIQSFNAQFHRNLSRILLQELPQRDGESTDYRTHVRQVFEEFRSGFGRHLFPMDTPLAIEVLVKPPPIGRQRGLHDLDNVCRVYLIPSLIELFTPPLSTNNSRPSPGSGLVRYEAWRVSRRPDDDSPGFVSVSIVSDLYPGESLFTRINQEAQKIIEEMD